MISVIVGDLASQSADAIIRPVRSDLAPVSVASRDIGIAAGEEFEERMARLGTLPIGGAILTPSGNLQADFVIHVVVSSEEEQQSSVGVQRALRNGLRRATDWGIASVALPPVGLGVGMAEPEDAARALVEILFNHLDEGAAPLDLTIVVASNYEHDIFAALITEHTRAREASRN